MKLREKVTTKDGTPKRTGRHLFGAVLGLACALGLAGLAVRGSADDTALFSSSVAPNVLLVIDNSGSMNIVMWHWAYRPDAVYDPANCPVLPMSDPDYDPRCLAHPLCNIAYGESGFDGDGAGTNDRWRDTDMTFRTLNGRTGILKCGNTRDVFVDPKVQAAGNQTRWQLDYLRWYFSDNMDEDPDGDGNTILEEILDPANGNTSPCVTAQDPTIPATYGKYNRSRVTAAKTVLREVICETSNLATIRYGLAKFYNDGGDPAGGYVRVPIDDYTAAQAAALDTGIDELEGEQWTPLGETMYNVYRYFQSRTSTRTALGKNGSSRFPVYDIGTSGSIGSPPPSPVTADCQKQFVLLITDGAPTRDDFDSPMSLSTFDSLIGDYNLPGDEDETPINEALAPEIVEASCGGSSFNTRACEVGLYVDDVAKFMNEHDFQLDPAFPSVQTIDTYTVGFTTSDVTNAILQKTAAAGNGEFFASSSAEELADAITQSLTSIIVKSKSFTAATVPASRATDGNNFFASYFVPQGGAFWPGDMKLFEYNRAGEVRDKPTAAQAAAGQPGDCALLDPLAPTRCLAGPLDLSKDGYWDAADEIPLATARDLYVSRYQSGLPLSIPATPAGFDESTMTAADLGLTAGDIASYSAVGNGTSGITTAEELADAVVRYLRGCEFGSGSCVDRGDGKKLWDIFHSNPVVVGPPNSGLRDQTYREFVSRYSHRKRVIYAGSNGGFVHGFNAGEYGTALVPDAYDRGTGAEEFGFMAWPARQNIAQLPLDDAPRGTASWSGYSMDGSPVASDVWLYPDPEIDPDDVTSNGWNQWRSVLIGGMRQGGNAYWALDVTNPPDFNSPGGEQSTGPGYPGYLWEFPCESSDATCTGSGVVPGGFTYASYMGETWGDPVITRVRVTVNCSSNCPTYDRWVAIFGGGYAKAGDPNDPAYDATLTSTTSRAGRAIFMVDITTGEVLAMRRFDHLSTEGTPSMRYALASTPAVFDLNFDGYADVVYAGDLGGNLWKWVINAAEPDGINGSGSVDVEHRWDGTSGWKFLKLFQAANCGPIDGCTGSPAPHYRSFFFPPAGALVGSELYLVIGSGERTNLDFVGTLDPQKNRFYVFKDKDPLERELTLPVAGVARYNDNSAGTDFVDAATLSGSCTPPPPPAVGFYLEGVQGEKFITPAEIFFGVVLTSSYVPSASASACDAGGDAYLYGFDLVCSEGKLPDPGDPSGPSVRRVSIGEGLPNRPRVSVGPVGDGGGGGGGGDCQDMVIVITSEGEAFSECPGGRPNAGVSLRTWRELNH